MNDFEKVFPMYVGVILESGKLVSAGMSIPHVCGGDPSYTIFSRTDRWYSPCMWG